MLDRPVNQAVGLLDLTPEPHTRVVAVVSHGDAVAELPLLLRLCAALVALGYPVTVLDGTVRENEGNPGLEQLLNYGTPPATSSEGASWSVLPALYGLQLWGSTSHGVQGLEESSWMFPHESVVIVYASATTIVQLVGDTAVRPVLAVSTGKSSLLTGYLALKKLLIRGKLSPMVVNCMAIAASAGRHTAPAGVALQDYAKYFLNYEVTLFSVAAAQSGFGDRAAEQLARALLESALPLTHTWSQRTSRMTAALAPDSMAGGH
jgi:hypothetical protein